MDSLRDASLASDFKHTKHQYLLAEVHQSWSSIPAVIKMLESKVCFSRFCVPPWYLSACIQQLHLATADTEVKGRAPVSVNLFRLNNTLLSRVACRILCFFLSFSFFLLLLCCRGWVYCSALCCFCRLSLNPHHPPPLPTLLTGYCHVFMATWFLTKHWQNACLYCTLPRPVSVLPRYQWA